MPDFPEEAVRAAAEAMQEEEDTRTYPTALTLARIALEAAEPLRVAALAGAGLVVVSAEDLDDAIDALAEREDVCFGCDCSDVYCQRVVRLRAALPERRTDAS